jgi:transposase InsO family protein
MPWKETCAVEQREQFIRLWLSGRYSKTALCEQFGISRPTGDKWIYRHTEFGMAGLVDRSCAPLTHPNAVDALTCEQIVQTKLLRPSWGPKKLLDLLRQKHPERSWPADSTGGEILKRAGLVKPKRHRRTVPADNQPFAHCDAANTVWSVDFKGDFRLGDGKRCYPLTISDNYSRYVLACQGVLRPSGQMVRPWFERTFRDYGLPYSIRSDNGSPFASKALGGLSALSKWWIDLGIRPERIEPGRPDQNGRHERMHRSLKAWLGKSSSNLNVQQERLNEFRREYNEERSHEALDRRTPAMLYRGSQRDYPPIIKPAEYGSEMTVRQVRSSGEIKWRGQRLYVSEVLAGEPVGMEPSDDGVWNLYYRFHSLGQLDDRTRKIVPATRWHGK